MLDWLRGRGKWETIEPEEASVFGFVEPNPKGQRVKVDMFDVITGNVTLHHIEKWFCTFCSRIFAVEDMTMLDDRFYCTDCIESMKVEDGPCCEAGDMCHGECAECNKCGREFCRGKCNE